jgi:fructose-1,6-bisphosphatase I
MRPRSKPAERDSHSSLEPRLHEGHLSCVSARLKYVLQNKATSVVTIERFIIEQERLHPQATGQLSGILYDMALAAKMIANKVRSAGLADILGSAGEENVQGEVQQKLDVFANETIIKAMDHSGRLCGMASEEEASIIAIPERFRCGKYCLMFDPLDGSSNIDVNVPVGTIFSIVQKATRGKHATVADFLQPGSKQVAAGYVIYGSSTMLVYTTGQGAHGFTLDPSIGEFLLSHPNIRIPADGRYLSVNDSYEQHWEQPVKTLMRKYRALEGDRKALNVRYVGSLVADFHRNLLGGGVFCYPANRKNQKGKLRLLYEANPLAFIVEQAGGAAIDGTQRIMDIQPTELHQRVPLYIGSKNDVDLASQVLAGTSELVGA